MTSFSRLFALLVRHAINVRQDPSSRALSGTSDFFLRSDAVTIGATRNLAFHRHSQANLLCTWQSSRHQASNLNGYNAVAPWELFPPCHNRPGNKRNPSCQASSVTPSSTAHRARAMSAVASSQTPEEVQMTRDVHAIHRAAMESVDPATAVRSRFRHVQGVTFEVVRGRNENSVNYDVEQDFDKIVLVGFGKASAAMATAVVEVLAQATPSILSKLQAGLIIVKDDHVTDSQAAVLNRLNVRVRHASHPVPDARSVEASQELLDMVRSHASARTLVVACISGGGSALFCCPHPRLTLQDLQETNSLLLQSGWSIHEMNVVRKRLEQGKGGKLAQVAYPSKLLSLVLSDVLGDPLDVIASGPTVPDSSNWTAAWELVQRYEHSSLGSAWPTRVRQLILDGHAGSLPNDDAPVTKDDPAFRHGVVSLVGNTAVAVSAAVAAAQSLGYHAVVLATQLQGEAAGVAQVLVSMAQYLCSDNESAEHTLLGHSAPQRVALIAGGETTVTLPPDCSGKGGRNQEVALSAALALDSLQLRQVVVCSVGTDGSDGPTDAAGAVVDGGTIGRLPGKARDYLQSHDSYSYLEQIDSSGKSPLIKTGPTGTNVADVVIVLVHRGNR